MPTSKVTKKSLRSKKKKRPNGKAARPNTKSVDFPIPARNTSRSAQGLAALVALVLPLATYTYYLCPTIAAGDSGELITGAKVLGIPHPPGYPLFTMIGHVFTWLPLHSIAWRVNLASALLSALACLFVYLALLKWTRRVWPALVGSLSLAFSRFFWHYAEVAEVFPLNSFFVALLTYVLIVLREQTRGRPRGEAVSPDPALRLFAFFSFVFGLALTNHHTVVLLAPATLFMLWKTVPDFFKKPKIFCLAILFILAGLTPYIYSPLAALAQPLINWDNPVTIENFFRLISRADYGSLSLLPTESQQNVAVSRFSQLPTFFASLVEQFTPLGVGLAVLGLLAIKRHKLLHGYLALGFFFSGIFFVMFANMPITNPLLLGVLHRFYIMPAIFFAFWIGLGMDHLLVWLAKAKLMRVAQMAAPVVLIVTLFVWQFATNREEADFRDNYIAEDFARNLLLSLPANALFFVRGDAASMGVDYLQMVQGERPDVQTLDQAKLTYPWYYQQVKTRFPELTLPGERYDGLQTRNRQLIDRNIDARPVCFMDFKEESYKDAFKPLPLGLIYRMMPKSHPFSVEALEKQTNQLFAKFTTRGLERSYPPTSFEYEIKQIYAEPFFRLGYEFEQVGNFQKAVTYYEKALQINPVNHKVIKNLAVVLFYKLNQRSRAAMLFRRYLELNPGDPETDNIQQLIRSYGPKLTKPGQ